MNPSILKVPLFVDIWVTLAGVRLRVLVVASLEPEDVEPLRLHRKDSTEQEIVSIAKDGTGMDST